MKLLAWIAGILALLSLIVAIVLLSDDPRFCWECATVGTSHSHRSDPPHISSSLKTLATAQADFRANDRDGDGKREFWRADVAGLYALTPKGESDRIKLIDLSVAAADSAPVLNLSGVAVKAAKRGYWFKALRHVDETPGMLDPNRFAFCAYPDPSSPSKYMFAIDENNTVFRAVAVKGGADVFPDLETLKKSWAKID